MKAFARHLLKKNEQASEGRSGRRRSLSPSLHPGGPQEGQALALRVQAATSARGTAKTTLPLYRICSYKRDGRSAGKKKKVLFFFLSVMNGFFF